MSRHIRPVLLLGAVLSVLVFAAGCSWVGGLFGNPGTSSPSTSSVSVFDVKIGQCFNPPKDVQAELANLTAIDCQQPHSQEAYALLPYRPAAGVVGSGYPGSDTLSGFADGACAQAFQGYDGISYLDSSLYFTYLLPSARSWEQSDDHAVLCLIVTTGQPLTSSVKGKKL